MGLYTGRADGYRQINTFTRKGMVYINFQAPVVETNNTERHPVCAEYTRDILEHAPGIIPAQAGEWRGADVKYGSELTSFDLNEIRFFVRFKQLISGHAQLNAVTGMIAYYLILQPAGQDITP
jgi:hypothetical protein